VSLVQLATLALAVTTLAISGCGSSSDSESKSNPTNTAATTAPVSNTTVDTSTPVARVPPVKVASGKPLTRAQWISAGDKICARLNAQLEATPVKGAKTFAVVIPQVAAYERTEVAELAKLVPPPTARDQWEEILTETLQLAENTAALGKTAQTSQFTFKTALVASTAKIRAELLADTKRIGFKECSSNAA
jgi:hypothetical protein